MFLLVDARELFSVSSYRCLIALQLIAICILIIPDLFVRIEYQRNNKFVTRGSCRSKDRREEDGRDRRGKKKDLFLLLFVRAQRYRSLSRVFSSVFKNSYALSIKYSAPRINPLNNCSNQIFQIPPDRKRWTRDYAFGNRFYPGEYPSDRIDSPAVVTEVNPATS